MYGPLDITNLNQMGVVEACVTSMIDELDAYSKKFRKHKTLLMVASCVIYFLLGLSMCTQVSFISLSSFIIIFSIFGAKGRKCQIWCLFRLLFICDVIKQNQSEVGNIDFEI